jgi:hypothetical protein
MAPPVAARALVRHWIDSPPEWLEIRQPALSPDAELLRIRIGRDGRDAIPPAQETGADDFSLTIRVDQTRSP